MPLLAWTTSEPEDYMPRTSIPSGSLLLVGLTICVILTALSLAAALL
jgi:hypothetical protein